MAEGDSSNLWQAVAAKTENLGEVAACLKDCFGKSGLEALGEDGTTPLQKAASLGRSSVMHLLLSQGAEPNAPSPSEIYTGYTALHYACARVGQEDAVRVLLSHSRTDVNARNAKGTTPLGVACAHGSPSIAQLLLAHPGIDKLAKDNDGVNALMLVAATGRDQFLDLLLQDPQIAAAINDADKNGDTALHHAFQIQLQRFFKNAYPVTPVQEALVYRLVRAGADPTIKNRDGLAPRYFASRPFKALLSRLSALAGAGCELPGTLDELLGLGPDALRGLATTDEGEELVTAVAKYNEARETALEAQAKMGGCPFVALQPRKPPADREDDDEDEEEEEEEEESEEESDEEDEDDSEDEDDGDEATSKGKSSTKDTATPTTTGLPTAHPGIAAGADISACPFFQKQKAGAAAMNATTATPTAAAAAPIASSAKTSTAGPGQEAMPAPKGKCPIPFHNELVDRRNWIFLAILIIAVYIARLI